MIRRIILVSALCLAATPSAKAADFADDSISLTFSSKSIANSVTEGGNTRGPALAVMKDDTVLLGGGRSGGGHCLRPLRLHRSPPRGRPA